MGCSFGRRLRMLSPVVGDGVAELRAAWRSHALTLIGLVWGSAAVVLLLSFGVGFTQFLDLGVEKTGDRWTVVQGKYTTAESGGRRPGRRVELTFDDLDRIRAGVPSALRAAGEVLEAASVETPHRTRATIVSAGSPEIRGIRNHAIRRGRYYDASDERSGRRVAVIGSELEGILFADADGLGRSLQIDGVPFEVVGVLAPKGSQLMTNMDLHDRMVFVPLGAGARLFRDRRSVDHIYVEPRRIDEGDRMEEEIRAALWPLHYLHPEESEAIFFESVPEILRPVRNVFVALQMLLGVAPSWVGAVASSPCVGPAGRAAATCSSSSWSRPWSSSAWAEPSVWRVPCSSRRSSATPRYRPHFQHLGFRQTCWSPRSSS
jgi:putative ABC transport system permease protein